MLPGGLFIVLVAFTAPELAMGKRYWRALSCPTYCSKETSPVCGSDGVIYKNDCDMRKRTCNRDVKAQDFKYCSQPEGSRCEHKCAKEKDLVCGSDGRTYLNKCFLMVEFCEHGITFSHYGSCTKDEPADEDKCPKSCSKRSRSRDGPVCGSDGNVYPSDCEMRKRTCGTGVVAVDRRHCQTTAHCDSGCWRISRLTCGSDGKLYNNGCQMHRKNCGKMVFDVPVPFCLNKLYRTDCPIDCRAEKDDRVCGSDGNIYRNQCELEKITCGYPLTRYERVTGVEWSLCAAKNSSCSKMNCPSDVDEMCGNDGVTYDNACLLRKATCTSGVQLSHVGACTDLSVIENKSDCPKNCDSENEGDEAVVCGSDGNVYRSMCELRMRTCGQRVVRAPYSHCEGTKSCDADCSAADGMTTVCASDALFYKSECHMRKDNCGRHVYVAPLSTCMKNFDFKFSGCGRVCPSEYDPVCGDDGKTYSNQCFMEMENCRARSLGGVKRKYYGKCGSPKQKARHYLYKK